MAKKDNKKLAKGLDAIFGNDLQKALDAIQNDEQNERSEIKISEIHVNPYQPRVEFNQEKLQELAQSIIEHGVFTPVLVRESLNGYELIAGERRLRASQLANKTTIPTIVLEMDDETMMQVTLLENIQRENLNAIEEANGYFTIINNLGYTQDELAKKLGKSRTYITNSLRLRKLPQKVQDYVISGSLSGSHVRTLLSLEDENEINKWAEKIIREKLSVHELENLIKNASKQHKEKKEVKKDIFLTSVQKNMESKLQTQVEIKKNQIIIKYSNKEDLNRILEKLDLLIEE